MNVLGLLKSNYANINKMNSLQKIISDSTKRLASGQKLTKDNPSDILRISRLDSELRGSQMAKRNVQDGISLIQTTGNALESVSSIGQRLKELSVQYNNGTLSDDDKNTIETEAKELTKQVSNIMNNTSFNGKNVFSSNSISIMAGNSTSDIVNINIHDISSNVAMTSSTSQVANNTNSTTSTVPRFTLPTPNLSNFPDQNGFTGYTVAWDLDGYLTYDGEMVNGLFDGAGIYYNKGQETYSGTWSKGKYNGYGFLYNTDGSLKYEGDIMNGTPDGYGKYYSDNGVIQYEGLIKNGYREGHGKTYDTNGNLIEEKDYTDYSGSPQTTPTTQTPSQPTNFSLKDIGSFDVKNILSNNFVDDNILKPITNMRQELGSTEEILNYKMDFLQTEEAIKTDVLSRIQDVDTAKEMLNMSKAQMLLQANTAMYSQINDMAQNMVKMLLA